MDPTFDVWLVLRMFAALVVVVTLAVVSIRFGLPWLTGTRVGRGIGSLRVEEALPLDRHTRLYVVRWNDERLLIASSADRAELLGRQSAGRTPERVVGDGGGAA